MKTKKIDYTELIAGLIVIAISIIGFISTFGTKSFATTVGVKSTDVPRWACYAMFALGIGIASRWFVPAVIKKNPPMIEVDTSPKSAATEEEKKKALFQKITMPLTLALIFLYIFLYDILGFVIDTIIYLTLQITLLSTDLSKKSFLKNFIIAAVVSIVVFLIFAKLFRMQLPVNNWGF